MAKKRIQADVIVLGRTLPGMVAAYKLMRKFGDTMDIVLLELSAPPPTKTRIFIDNVAFTEVPHDESDSESEHVRRRDRDDFTARQVLDNVARLYLLQYAKDLRVPLPDAIIYPEGVENYDTITIYRDGSEPKLSPEASLQRIPLQKLFQYPNGSTVQFLNNVHDFEYLNLFEKFELNQYQTFLDRSMTDLFQTSIIDIEEERKMLLYYDQTTMEKHICQSLIFSTSREIMRIIVGLVCGTPANSVSLLFYLHQCYRTSSAKNHLGGLNTRFREKLLRHCRHRLSSKLTKSVADITLKGISIKGIRTYSEQVILETIKGETTYICNLLAMALRPDQLHNIQVEDKLLSKETRKITKDMKPGRAKIFHIQYANNFWSKQGYSGDIFSMRGPVIWAMEKPSLSTTGSLEKYSGLIGYLMVRDDNKESKEAVLEQLVKLFGSEAADPVTYREMPIADVFVPRCGDYVALRSLTSQGSPKFIEWGALDIFNEGDVASALEAGHSAYLHLMGCLRPQAQTFNDVIACEWPTFLSESPFDRWMSQINVYNSIKITMFAASLCIGIHLLRVYMSK